MNTKDYEQLSAAMLDKVIGGEYQLLEVLGHGAFGCLFLGQLLSNHTYVAVKVLSKSGLDHEQRKLQQLEIDIQSSLKHPYLLQLFRVIEDNEHIFMVMELCDQGDLFDYVIQDQEDSKFRDEAVVKKAFLQILEALDYMHSKNIYHRDIKLENVLLKYDDDDIEFVCKVADFGLATRDRFSLEFGCGSGTYLAPEHFEEGQSINESDLLPYDAAASDVWSLGVLLLAFLFGRNPWEEASVSDPAYMEFRRNPAMLRELFPDLSLSCFSFLKSIFTSDATARPSVKELKTQFLAVDTLYTTANENEEDDDQVCTPVDIPHVSKYEDHAGCDSAYFSASRGGSRSWSDMVEEDENYAKEECFDHSSPFHDDDDPDMFVHHQEKESWWL